jgi:hypothetical protein
LTTTRTPINTLLHRDIGNKTKPEEHLSELIKVQIAGVQYPQWSRNHQNNRSNHHIAKHFHDSRIPRNNEGYNNWIDSKATHGNTRHGTLKYGGSDYIQKLSQEQCVVRCQFLACRVPNYDDPTLVTQQQPYRKNLKRPIPGMTETTTNMMDATIPLEDKLEHQVAIVKLYYHDDTYHHYHNSGGKIYTRLLQQLFQRRLDLGESMIRKGYAIVAENGLYSSNNDTTNTSMTTRKIDTIRKDGTTGSNHEQQQQQIQDDVQYMDRLTRAEYHAAQSYAGIWNDPTYRTERSDVIDEIHYQQHSTMIQKLFRWIRGG